MFCSFIYVLIIKEDTLRKTRKRQVIVTISRIKIARKFLENSMNLLASLSLSRERA